MAISNLEHQPLILGHNWLKKYNPEINWQEHLISFLGEEHLVKEDLEFFATNILFVGPKDETLYALDLQAYLQL